MPLPPGEAVKGSRSARATRTGIALLLLLQLSAPPDAGAAPKPLRFFDKTDLPSLGLRIRLMANAREVPTPAIEAFPYTITSSTTETRLDMFRPYDLWYRTQLAGEWIDRQGTRLRVAAIRNHLPTGFTRPHVSRDEYAARQAEISVPAEWTMKELKTWCAAFSERPELTATRMPSRPSRMRDLVRFTDNSESILLYAFRLKHTALGQLRAPPGWFVIEILVGDTRSAAAVARSAERSLIPYIAAMPQSGNAHTRAPSRQFQSVRHTPEGTLSPEFLTSRKQVVQSIQNMEDWWYAETDNYIILSNVRARYRDTIREMQGDLEMLHSAFRKLIAPRAPISAVSVIRIFEEPKHYESYVGEKHKWSGGIWVPTRKELVIRALSANASGEALTRMLRTTYHEAFHQYLHYAMGEVDTSVWFNEGHAMLFEHAEVTRRRVWIRESSSPARLLQTELQKPGTSLPQLLKFDYPQFYDDDKDTRLRHYLMAWGLIYYLRKEAEQDRHSPYKMILSDYVDALWETRDAAVATRRAFADIDMATLEKDYNRFWSSPDRRAAADRKRLF